MPLVLPTTTHIRLEREGPVLRLWLNRPETRNALSADMVREIQATFDAIRAETQLLYASDWPHHDFDHPKKVWDIPVSATAKRKMLGETAMRILRLPASARHALVPGKRVAE